jgi:hypothetical protein
MIHQKIIQEWYNNYKIIYKIIQHTKEKELALITPTWSKQGHRNVRHLRCHNFQTFQYIKKWSGVIEKGTLYQIYVSLAKYKGGMRKIPFKMDQRKEHTKKWNEEHYKYMTQYDFLIDIDGTTHDQFFITKMSADNIKKYFDKLKIPYYLSFSGNGFHFRIPHSIMTTNKNFNPEKTHNIYKEYYQIAKALRNKFTEQIDIKIYDARRVYKIPYTLALYPYEPYAYVCYPFSTDEEYENFTLEKATPENVLINIDNIQQQLFNKEHAQINTALRKIKKDLKIKCEE